MRSSKKRPAKRRESNPIVGKLLKLKYRINDAYHNSSKSVDKADKDWVMSLIADVRRYLYNNLSHEDMLKCNELWRKYD
tara:strand:+ start:589 stop:825 length:237 start_codon:yes stop_codon:yes gene_type:complete